MIPNVQVTDQQQGLLATEIGGSDWFVATNAVVTLVETAFDPKVVTSYPTDSAHFANKTSSGLATVVFDAPSGKRLIVWPDPTGGWVFTAATITVPITVNGYVVRIDGFITGGNTISPVTITANGQLVVLPSLSIELPPRPIPDSVTPASV